MTLFGVGANSSPDAKSGVPKTLFGYDVLDKLGDGAGSTIYAVSDPKSNHLFALKHVVNDGEKTLRFIEQLEAEHAVGQLVRHHVFRAEVDRFCHSDRYGRRSRRPLLDRAE